MRVLIVDGYNAIHAWSDLRRLIDSHDLEEARRQFIAALADYAGASGVEVTVVFDAHTSSGEPSQETVDGVTVRFGTKTQTADHIIERLAYAACRNGPARDIVVATSDRLQAGLVMNMGVATMSAGALEAEIRSVAKDRSGESRRGGGTTGKFRRVEDQLDPAVRERLERLRRGE